MHHFNLLGDEHVRLSLTTIMEQLVAKEEEVYSEVAYTAGTLQGPTTMATRQGPATAGTLQGLAEAATLQGLAMETLQGQSVKVEGSSEGAATGMFKSL